MTTEVCALSEESERFLQGLVTQAEHLTPHEMVERFEQAIDAISAGRGTVAWRDGQPIGGSIWQPKVRWHVDSTTAHVFVDVSSVSREGVTIEARPRALNLIFKRVKERVLADGKLHSHEEVSQRTVELGVDINISAVSAKVEDDIMHIRCPRDSAGLSVVDINWDAQSV